MARRLPAHAPRRLSRTRVKLGLMTVGVAAAGGALSFALLVEGERAPAATRDGVAQVGEVGRSPATTPLAARDPAAATPDASSPALPRPVDARPLPRPVPVLPKKPERLGDLLASTARPDSGDLATWVKDRELAPNLRYAALRRLEADSPGDAVPAAIAVLNDATSLVRLNAIAVLARSQDPRAKEALGRIDARSQRLAQNLVARR